MCRPSAASTQAMLATTDVLPSEGSHEVTAIDVGPPSGMLKSRLLRSSWKASITMGWRPRVKRLDGRMFPLMTRGISPSTVAPIRSFNSVTRLNRRRTPAEASPANTAAMRPKPMAAKRMGMVGLDGVAGTCAGSGCVVS